jgi:hypothetical protein
MTPILTLMFWLALGAAQQTATGSVEGTVLRTGTAEPIERVEVTLSPGVPTPITVLTDKEGRFSFPNVAPGGYTINIHRDGYLVPGSTLDVASFQPAEPSPPTRHTVNVGSGESVKGLTFFLTPGGIISGRILDLSGRPSVGVDVYALSPVYQEGRATVSPVKSALTNDRGEYRIFWLEPGSYVVRAQKDLPSGAARAYYPGTGTAAGSVEVRVTEGTESPRIDIALQRDVTYKISGYVTNIVAGLQSPLSPSAPAADPLNRDAVRDVLRARLIAETRSVTPPQFFLSPINADEVYDGVWIGTNALTGAEDVAAGKFEIRNVRPGSYNLIALIADRSSTPPRYFAGKTSVEVGFQDTSDVNLLIAPGRDLRGRVVYTPSVSPPNAPVRVQLRPKGLLPILPLASALSAVAEVDGTFTIFNVPDFQYSVSLSSLGKDDYISDLRQGSFSVFDVGAIVPGKRANDDFEVIVDSPGASINGKVAAGATIVLVPDERRQENLMLHKRTNASSAGVFSFTGVAPGRYRLFAFEYLPTGAEFNREFMNAHLGEAQDITVAPGDTTAVELRLTTR